MKKIIAFGVVMGLLFTLIPVFAQEDTGLPDPGITPDNPFYGVKRGFEDIGLAFTFGEINRAQAHYNRAQTRLSEADAMIKKNKTDVAEELVQDYEEELNETEVEVEKAAAKGQNVTLLVEHVANMTSKHIAVLQRVYEQVSEQAKASIMKVIEKASDRELGILKHLENETEQEMNRTQEKEQEKNQTNKKVDKDNKSEDSGSNESE